MGDVEGGQLGSGHRRWVDTMASGQGRLGRVDDDHARVV